MYGFVRSRVVGVVIGRGVGVVIGRRAGVVRGRGVSVIRNVIIIRNEHIQIIICGLLVDRRVDLKTLG